MSEHTPDYRLQHVEDGDCDGHVEIVPIGQLDTGGTPLARREAFRAGLTAAAVLGLLSACGTTSAAPTSTFVPTTTPPTTTPRTTTPPPTTPAQPPVVVVPPTTRRPPPPTTSRRPRPRPSTPRRSSGGGGSLTKPCDRQPVPAGYVCTCNCVRVPG